MLDTRTIVFSYAISNVVCMFVIGLLWHQNRKRFAGLSFWLADFILQFVGVLLVALRGLVPNFLSIVVSNVFVMGGTILFLMGLERFVGKPRPQAHNFISLGIFAFIQIFFTYVQPSLLVRNINVALMLIFLCIQGAWLMLRRVEVDQRAITRGLGHTLLVFCIVAAAHVQVDFVMPPGNNFLEGRIFDTLFLLVNQVLFVILTFGLFLMVNRRLVAELERDISQRRQTEEALRLSEEKFSKAFRSSPDAVLITRARDGKIVEVNEGFSRLTGYSQEEALANSSINLGMWANLQDREACVAALQQHNSLREVEYDFRDRHGKIINGLYSGEIIHLDNEAHILSVIHDLTARKQAELALRKSTENIRHLVESAPDAILVIQQDGKIAQANMATIGLFGYSPEELIGMDIDELLPARFREEHASQRASFAANPRTRPMGSGLEVFARRRDGSELVADISLSHLESQSGLLITVFIRDVTERKTLENALRYQNKVLEALQRVMLDLVNRRQVDDILQALLVQIGVLLAAPHTSIDLLEDNDTLVTYAATPGQPLEKGDRMQRGAGGWLSWQAIESGQPAVLEDYSAWPRRRQFNDSFTVHAVLITPIKLGGQVIGTINSLRSEPNQPFNQTDIYAAVELAQLTALVLDNAQVYTQLQAEITERSQKEDALLAAQTQLVEQQRTLAAFDERQRLGRNLHDSVNQSIHSLVMFAETLTDTLGKNNLPRARQLAERLQESARQVLQEMRLMLYELRASDSVTEIDLARDLEIRLATVERRAGIQAQVIQEGLLENCPKDWNENLFWITIEALNNALKHAQARKVEITLRCTPQQVELEIVDDGKGFDPASLPAGGMGLLTMRERAALLGGGLTINSAPGQGTRVHFQAEIK